MAVYVAMRRERSQFPERGGQYAALKDILGRLTASGPAAAYRYTLVVTTDEIPNAFAAPGGFVVVTRGLLR